MNAICFAMKFCMRQGMDHVIKPTIRMKEQPKKDRIAKTPVIASQRFITSKPL